MTFEKLSGKIECMSRMNFDVGALELFERKMRKWSTKNIEFWEYLKVNESSLETNKILKTNETLKKIKN